MRHIIQRAQIEIGIVGNSGMMTVRGRGRPPHLPLSQSMTCLSSRRLNSCDGDMEMPLANKKCRLGSNSAQ